MANKKELNVDAKINIDDTKLDASLEKAKRLVDLLQEAQLIINSLAPQSKL